MYASSLFQKQNKLGLDPKMEFVSLQVNIWHCPILLVLDDHGSDSESCKRRAEYMQLVKKTRHHPKEIRPEIPPKKASVIFQALTPIVGMVVNGFGLTTPLVFMLGTTS